MMDDNAIRSEDGLLTLRACSLARLTVYAFSVQLLLNLLLPFRPVIHSFCTNTAALLLSISATIHNDPDSHVTN
jgi:hypothetical protein